MMRKHFFISLVGLFAVVLMVFFVSYTVVQLASNKYIFDDPVKLPQAQAVLIPGAAILNNGEISPILRDREDMAISIYNSGVVKKILVTGDNSSLNYNEVRPMKNYLIKKGIPEKDIFVDYAGFDTYSSIYRAKEVFQIDSVIIVSQSFHLPRAVFIARNLGLLAFGAVADRGSYLLRNDVRELFGDVKAILNLLFRRQPKYLGVKIPITGNGNTL